VCILVAPYKAIVKVTFLSFYVPFFMHHVTDTGILIWTYACDCDCTVLCSITVGRTVQKKLFKHL